MLYSTAVHILKTLPRAVHKPAKTLSFQWETPIRWQSSNARQQIDRSKVPMLDEHDLEENFISGSGPGGQSVNKAVNCCQLRHKPSGLIVKVHQQRSLEKNRQIARELLTARLDNLYNGEASVENQMKRIALARLATREAQQQRRKAMKEGFKRNILVEEAKESGANDVVNPGVVAGDIDDINSNKKT